MPTHQGEGNFGSRKQQDKNSKLDKGPQGPPSSLKGALPATQEFLLHLSHNTLPSLSTNQESQV